MFDHGKPFQLGQIVGKAGANHIEEPFRRSTLEQALRLADKQQTRLGRLARDKH